MTPHDGGPVGGNGATKSRASEDHRLARQLYRPPGDSGVDRAPVPMPKADAGRVTSEVRQALTELLWSVHTIRRLIEKARDGQAHLSLGYRSWTEYVSEEFGRDKFGHGELGPKTKLARDDRQKLVAQLADLGMSTRAIGSFVGAGKSTIADDLRSGVRNRTPEPSGAGADGEADEVEAIAAATETTSNVVGLDGKNYSKPEPRKASRPPLPRVYGDAVRTLLKLAERVERYHFDDRFGANRDSMLVRNRAALLQAHKKLTAICTSIGVDTGAEPPLCRECRNRLVIGPPSRVAELAKLAEAERLARGPS